MRKNFEKMLVWLLVLCITCSLVACAGGNSESGKPSEPTDPSQTTAPTTPDATKPSEPTTPTEPTKPAEPSNPTTPTEPDPTEPTKPVGTDTPTEPPAPTTPPHKHSYSATRTVKPTCTSNGYTVYSCACGDSYNADATAALGHSFGGWVTTEATPFAEGVQTRTCTTCGATETQPIAKLPMPQLDYAAAIAYGNAYGASTYGFIVDTSLNADNAGYGFATYTSTETVNRNGGQDFLNQCVCNYIDALVEGLLCWDDTVEGYRINCTVYDGDDGKIWYNVYYG